MEIKKVVIKAVDVQLDYKLFEYYVVKSEE